MLLLNSMRIKAFLAGKLIQSTSASPHMDTTHSYILQETTYGTCKVRIGRGIFSKGVLPASGLYEII